MSSNTATGENPGVTCGEALRPIKVAREDKANSGFTYVNRQPPSA